MTKEEFKIALSNGYVGDNSHFARILANIADYIWENKKRPVKVIAAATTLTEEDSGKLLVLNAAAGAQVTLPVVADAAGCEFTFVVGAAFATTNWTVKAATNKIQGGAIVNSALVSSADQNTVSFVANAETVGDTVTINSDGTNFYVKGVGKTAGSITFTAP